VKTDKQEVDRRMGRFNKACRDSGAKLTHQRMEIFREVAQTGEHPDVEKVYRGVRERIPTISLDTVYRTLWWLKDLGLVATLGSSRERARFDANLDRHHHFVCNRCGLTRDFYSQKLDKLNITESVQAIGTVETTQVEVKGVCLDCAEKERKPNQENQKGR
jgi:Fur family transcriptional regulator, peroxide stress response regulator